MTFMAADREQAMLLPASPRGCPTITSRGSWSKSSTRST
jgi:hypothetical protein